MNEVCNNRPGALKTHAAISDPYDPVTLMMASHSKEAQCLLKAKLLSIAAYEHLAKGEEDLAETITVLLKNYSRLTQSTKRLLRQAYKDAKSRQRLSGLH